MYNAKPIDDFIRKVEKEAEAAAQKVFDSYENELIQKIKRKINYHHLSYLMLIFFYKIYCFNKKDILKH
jgi:hypothetical protein